MFSVSLKSYDELFNNNQQILKLPRSQITFSEHDGCNKMDMRAPLQMIAWSHIPLCIFGGLIVPGQSRSFAWACLYASVATSQVARAAATGARAPVSITCNSFFGSSFALTVTEFLKLTLHVVDLLLEGINVVLESVDDFDCLLRELLVQPFAELAVFSGMLIKKENFIVDVLLQRLFRAVIIIQSC